MIKSYIYRAINNLFHQQVDQVLVMMVLLLLSQVMMITPAIIIGKIVTSFEHHNVIDVLTLSGLFVLLVGGICILGTVQMIHAEKLLQNTLAKIGYNWIKEILNKNFDFFKKFHGGSLLGSYDRGLQSHYWFYYSGLEVVVQHFFKSLCILVYLIYLGGINLVGVVIICGILLTLCHILVISKKRPILKKFHHTTDNITRSQTEIWQSLQSIQIAGAMDNASGYLKELYNIHQRVASRYDVLQSIINAAQNFLPILCSCIILWLALNDQSAWSSGDFVTLFLLSIQFMDSWFCFWNILDIKEDFIQGQNAMQKALDYHTASPTKQPKQINTRCESSDQKHYTLQINPFVFSLSTNKTNKSPNKNIDLINKHTLLFPLGSKIAITGKSGQGKTTFAKIMTNIIEVSQAVKLDGYDLSAYNRSIVCESIYFEGDSPLFLHGNFPQAVLWGKEFDKSAITSELLFKLNLSHIPGILPDNWKKQWDYQHLSSCEKNMIGILRAYLLQRPITILDEPTAHLPPDMKDLIWKLLKDLFVNRSLICISHDSQINHFADKMISIKNHHITLL